MEAELVEKKHSIITLPNLLTIGFKLGVGFTLGVSIMLGGLNALGRFITEIVIPFVEWLCL